MPAVFELGGKYFVYNTDDAGEATGQPIAGPFENEEQANAALAEMSKPEAEGEMGAEMPNKEDKPKEEVMTPKRVTKSIKESTVMPTTDARLGAVENQLKALRHDISARVITGETREENGAFKTLAENLAAIKAASAPNGVIHPRLGALKSAWVKATGANEGIGSEGGFLLEPTIAREVMMPMREGDSSPFVSRARKLPVGPNSNSGWINGVDETSRVTGSRWGGIRGYRLSEAQQKTASKPAFKRLNWALKKYAVLFYATDELLQDASLIASMFQQGAGEELAFMANDDVLNGDGIGGPLGILNSTSLITVSAEGGQAAATIVYANVLKMWARLHPRYHNEAVWYANVDTQPQLHQLALPVGTGGLEPRFVNYSGNTLTMFGRPVVFTEFNATLGTVGDLVLAGMSDYLFFEKGSAEFANSIHLKFDYDETVYRAVYRCDGFPATPALTPYKGANTVSAFVALATR